MISAVNWYQLAINGFNI